LEAFCREQYGINCKNHTKKGTDFTRFLQGHSPINFPILSFLSCFKFPLIDLSAAGRINTFFQNESKITHPTHLIIIIDSVSEAFKYSKTIRDFDRHRSLSRTERGICLYSAMDRLTSDLFYLKRSDLEEGKEESLFFVSGYMEGHDKEENIVVFKENELFSLLPEKSE